MENELQGSQSAAHEARALYLMIGAGHDVEELRTLIAVRPKIKAALLAYAEADPRDAYWIEATLNLEVPHPDLLRQSIYRRKRFLALRNCLFRLR